LSFSNDGLKDKILLLGFIKNNYIFVGGHETS